VTTKTLEEALAEFLKGEVEARVERLQQLADGYIKDLQEALDPLAVPLDSHPNPT